MICRSKVHLETPVAQVASNKQTSIKVAETSSTSSVLIHGYSNNSIGLCFALHAEAVRLVSLVYYVHVPLASCHIAGQCHAGTGTMSYCSVACNISNTVLLQWHSGNTVQRCSHTSYNARSCMATCYFNLLVDYMVPMSPVSSYVIMHLHIQLHILLSAQHAFTNRADAFYILHTHPASPRPDSTPFPGLLSPGSQPRHAGYLIIAHFMSQVQASLPI